jgi:hypothetical protein
MRRTQGPPVRLSRALPAPPPSISRTRSFLLSLQPSVLGGVEHVPADLFEHTTPTATGSAYQSACVCCGDAYLAFSFVLALLTPRRSRVRASTPALLAPRVVVRVVHCAVQHEQALRLRIAPPRAYTHTLHLALRAPPRRTPDPPMTHLLRRASRSATAAPDAHAVVEPLPHGEAALLPSAPHVHIVSPVCRGDITPPARSPFVVVLLPTSASLFASNTSFASVSRPTPPPRLRTPSAYTSASSLSAAWFAPASSSDGYRATWTQEHDAPPAIAPRAIATLEGAKSVPAVQTGAPTPKKGASRRPSSHVRCAAHPQAQAERGER